MKNEKAQSQVTNKSELTCFSTSDLLYAAEQLFFNITSTPRRASSQHIEDIFYKGERMKKICTLAIAKNSTAMFRRSVLVYVSIFGDTTFKYFMNLRKNWGVKYRSRIT